MSFENIIQATKPPTLSFSRIDQYTNCSLKFYLNKIAKVQVSTDTKDMDFGDAIHQGCDYLHSNIISSVELPSKSDVVEVFVKHMEDKRLKSEYELSKDEYNNYINIGRELLTIYHDNNYGTDWFNPPLVWTKTGKPVLETLVNVPLIDFSTGEVQTTLVKDSKTGGLKEADLYMWVKFDLVHGFDNDIVLVDHKTSKRAYSKEKIENSLQLTIYYYALRYFIETNQIANPDNKDIKVCFNIFYKKKEKSVERELTDRTLGDVRRMFNIAKATASGMTRNVYTPNESNTFCSYCNFKDACKFWGRYEGNKWLLKYYESVKKKEEEASKENE